MGIFSRKILFIIIIIINIFSRNLQQSVHFTQPPTKIIIFRFSEGVCLNLKNYKIPRTGWVANIYFFRCLRHLRIFLIFVIMANILELLDIINNNNNSDDEREGVTMYYKRYLL